jgi:ubiquinone/menaquinone biosynthesis C-methylase UbiE
MSEYCLGSSDLELARLALQHEVWARPTAEVLDACGLAAGASAMDAGCGPGHVLELLRERVGPAGRVIALDESERWTALVRARAAERGWKNVEVVRSRLQDVELAASGLDLVFMRWVLSFPADPGAIVARLARLLRPGGRLAVLDYNHEGISIFPESPGFRAAVRATRAWYARGGGDAFIAGKLPRLFREAGLVLEQALPKVIVGGPGSPAFRWADAFFPHYSLAMEEAGLLSAGERRAFLDEWDARRRDPDAFFCSPIVIGMIARRAA